MTAQSIYNRYENATKGLPLFSLDREELICYKKYVIRRYRREVIVLRRYGIIHRSNKILMLPCVYRVYP